MPAAGEHSKRRFESGKRWVRRCPYLTVSLHSWRERHETSPHNAETGAYSRRGAQAAMTLPALCIRRPVMTTSLTLAIVLVGLIGYVFLPVAALPKVDFPTITVSTSLPGASPSTM